MSLDTHGLLKTSQRLVPHLNTYFPPEYSKSHLIFFLLLFVPLALYVPVVSLHSKVSVAGECKGGFCEKSPETVLC